MPSISLHPRPSTSPSSADNPLPQLLQTPSGLAILELQGTINLPEDDDQQENNTATDENESLNNSSAVFETPVGKLMFPDYSPLNPDDTKWMKRVYLYVGRFQRMTGEVKKLGQPIAVVQRRPQSTNEDELEIVEVVKYKLFFKSRPEPVNYN